MKYTNAFEERAPDTELVIEIRKLNREQGEDRAMRNSLLRELQRAEDRIKYIEAESKGWFPSPLPWFTESYHRCKQVRENIRCALVVVSTRIIKRKGQIADAIALRKLEKGYGGT